MLLVRRPRRGGRSSAAKNAALPPTAADALIDDADTARRVVAPQTFDVAALVGARCDEWTSAVLRTGIGAHPSLPRAGGAAVGGRATAESFGVRAELRRLRAGLPFGLGQGRWTGLREIVRSRRDDQRRPRSGTPCGRTSHRQRIGAVAAAVARRCARGPGERWVVRTRRSGIACDRGGFDGQ